MEHLIGCKTAFKVLAFSHDEKINRSARWPTKFTEVLIFIGFKDRYLIFVE